MLITDRPDTDVAVLRTRLHGEVYGPADAGYDEARRPWNLSVDQRPAVVAFARTDEDVKHVIGFAREHGLRVAAQATGHGAAANGPLDGTILISTKHLRGVRIDPVNRTARVRAGALWQDVTAPAAIHGLAPLAGSAGHVGVVGYTLGGGLGWLGRAHGLACNSVTAIELVTPDGEHVRTDNATDPELFWGLRGGKTQAFGIVTAIEFKLYPVDELHGGALAFSIDRAPEIFAAWRDWTQAVPETVSSLCRVLNIQGRSFVAIEVAVLGELSVVDPLMALGPEFGEIRPMSPAELIEIHNDPKEPSPGMCGHLSLSSLPDEAIDALVAHATDPLVSVELRHLGGALGRGSVCHGAANWVQGAYAMFAVGVAPSAEAAMAVDSALTRLTEALRPFDAGRAIGNFAEGKPARLFDGYTVHRLRQLKARMDPDGLLSDVCPPRVRQV
jgi:UDP-N-acetylenolpyruvoylglucosamine reductase